MTNPLPSVIETDKIEIIFYDVEITNQTLIAPNLKKIFYRRCSGRMFDGDAIVYLEDCKFAEIPLSLPLGSTVDWYSKHGDVEMLISLYHALKSVWRFQMYHTTESAFLKNVLRYPALFVELPVWSDNLPNTQFWQIVYPIIYSLNLTWFDKTPKEIYITYRKAYEYQITINRWKSDRGYPVRRLCHICKFSFLDQYMENLPTEILVLIFSDVPPNIPRSICKNIRNRENIWNGIIKFTDCALQYPHARYCHEMFYNENNILQYSWYSLRIYPARSINCNLFRKIHTVKLYQHIYLDDISALASVHVLDLSYTNVVDVSALGRVHTLNLAGCRVKDISALSAVHTLNLSWCQRITDFSVLGYQHTLNLSNTQIEDISALSAVHTLDLNGCQAITNFSALGSQHTLNLANTSIEDISALGNVHTLNLSTTHTKDVSALSAVHTLDLSHTSVEDVSALGNVHTLNLSYCYKIKDISALVRVVNLTCWNCLLLKTGIIINNRNLHHCFYIKNFIIYKYCHIVKLSGCRAITDVSLLKHCHTLDISYTNVKDVSALGRVHTLNIAGCRVEDVSALGNVHTLDLSNCDKIKDYSKLGKVYDLNISGSDIVDIRPLRHVHTLNLTYCCKIKDFRPLCSVRKLILRHTLVVEVWARGAVQELDLSYCKKLCDVSRCDTVHTLNLSHTKVWNVSMLRGVKRLDISYTDVNYISMLKCNWINIIHTNILDDNEAIVREYPFDY